MPVHSAAEALKMNSMICDGTPLAKVLFHTLLLAVPTSNVAPVAAAVGVLASVCVLSLPTGTVTEGNSSFNRLGYSENKLDYTTENISFGNIYL